MPEDDPEVAEQKAWWESSLRCFLTSGASGRCKQRPQKYRLAAHYFLLMLNTTLVTCTGKGLEQSATAATLELAASLGAAAVQETIRARITEAITGPWRWLGVPIDQRSVEVCGSNFLRNKLRLLMEPIFDPSHRVSNDHLLGIKAAGYFPILLAMKLCYCLNYGPWDGAKWWRDAQQCLKDIVENYSKQLYPLAVLEIRSVKIVVHPISIVDTVKP